MPDGFKVGSGYITVSPDLTGFDEKLKTDLARDQGAIKIPAALDRTRLTADLAAARKEITNGPDPEVKVKAKADLAAAYAAGKEIEVESEKSANDRQLKIKAWADDVAAKHAGEQIGQDVAQSAAESGRSFGGLLPAAIAGALIVGAPLVAGAAVGVGVAAIAGLTAVLNKDNVGLKQAWGTVANDAEDAATQASAGLVGPLTDALNRIDRQVNAERPVLNNLFAGAKADIPILTDGFNKFTSEVLPAMANMMQHSTPIAEGLAHVLTGAGQGVAGILNSVASNAPAAGEDLSTLGDIVHEVGDSLGSLVGIGVNLGRVVLPLLSDELRGLSAILQGVDTGVGAVVSGWEALASTAWDQIKSGIEAAMNSVAASVGVQLDWNQVTDRSIRSLDNYQQRVITSSQGTNAASSVTKDLAANMKTLDNVTASAAQRLAALQGVLKDVAQNGAEQSNDALATTWSTLNGLSSSLQGTTGHLLTAAGGLDLTTTKGEAANTTIETLRANVASYAQALANENATQDTVHQKTTDMINQMIGPLANALGISKAKVQELLQQYGLTPDDITTNVHANTKSAMDQIGGMIDRVHQVPNFWQTAFGNNADAEKGPVDRYHSAITSIPNFWQTTLQVNQKGPTLSHATGGIDLPVGFADGGVAAPSLSPIAQVVPPNTPRLIGDNMTTPEAFIPLDGSGRSRSILAEANRIMGDGGTTINNWNVSTQDPYQAAQMVSAQMAWNQLIGAHG